MSQLVKLSKIRKQLFFFMNVAGFYDGWPEFNLAHWEWMECFDRNFHNLGLNIHMSKHDMDSQQWLFKNEESKPIGKDNRKKSRQQ